MPNTSQHKEYSLRSDITAIFAALGDPTRLEIISRLQNGSTYSISKLSEGISLTRQGVSRHLHVLETAGLISAKRVGREALYSLEVETLHRAENYLHRASKQWDNAILRLTRHLDG